MVKECAVSHLPIQNQRRLYFHCVVINYSIEDLFILKCEFYIKLDIET